MSSVNPFSYNSGEVSSYNYKRLDPSPFWNPPYSFAKRGKKSKLKKEENIRLKEGELCNIERKFDDNLGALLRHVIREFERRCRRFDVTVDTTQHIQDVLRTEAILYDQAYYTGLASELGRIRRLN